MIHFKTIAELHEARELPAPENALMSLVRLPSEALHLSPREEDIMRSLFHKMEEEYQNNPDEFSKSIILSHLDSCLKYAERFYKRQFIDCKPLSGATVTKFNHKQEYLGNEKFINSIGLYH